MAFADGTIASHGIPESILEADSEFHSTAMALSLVQWLDIDPVHPRLVAITELYGHSFPLVTLFYGFIQPAERLQRSIVQLLLDNK
ncbi:MAG TPA: hypothetical protein VIK82_09885, partial [Porticoccaceae bacterium]